MPAIFVKKSVWNGLSASVQALLRQAASRLELGSGVEGTISGVSWFVWDDPRFDLTDIAILGCCAANLGLLPDTTGKTAAQIRAQITTFVSGRVVLPSAIDYSGSTNVQQTTLNAQGAPVTVKAADAPATVGWVAL